MGGPSNPPGKGWEPNQPEPTPKPKPEPEPEEPEKK
jgi:hypothetical protein